MTRLFRFLFNICIFPALLFFIMPDVNAADFYWEEPQMFSSVRGTFPVSAHSQNFSVIAWQEAVVSAAGGRININLAVKETGSSWEQRGRAGGSYNFLGSEPSILSMIIDYRGRIIIAAAAGDANAEILISEDRGRTFTSNIINLGAENTVAPRIYNRSDGGYLLFVTRGRSQSMTIYYSRSDDGLTWSSFVPFVTENNLTLNFLPTHASIGQRDFVIFQSLIADLDTMSAFQLFFKTSDDGGRTWSEARRFTSFLDPVIQTQASPNNFDNQRPHIINHNNNLFLVWERRYANQSPHVYCATINSNGNVIGLIERVNSDDVYCQNPIGFIHDNTVSVAWFDNRGGNNKIILAQKRDLSWTNYQLSGAGIEAAFARPVVTSDGAYIFYQVTARNTDRIYILSPDITVTSPRITALNFTPSQAGRTERTRVTWNIPVDTSGIYGFSWSWTQDERINPSSNVMIYNTGNTADLSLELNALEEGPWYFSVSAQDFAGNWSQPSRVMYYKKATPPPQVAIITPETDENGFLLSNTLNMQWLPSSDPYVTGYTWNLQYLGLPSSRIVVSESGHIDNIENAVINTPPSYVMGSGSYVNYINQDNGIWAFSISAIDQAGNIGQPSNVFFALNKYIPYTSVTFIDARQDEQGILSLRLAGRGFTTDGEITQVVLERSGYPDQTTSFFNVVSDREISGIEFDNIEEGRYRLRLLHSGRGWYSAETEISTIRTGTVKYGDYTKEWRPLWSIKDNGLFSIDPILVLAALLIIFCMLGSIAIIRGIGGVITEGALVQKEALAIITGDFMPMEKKQKVVQIQLRGRGLRFKLASFTIGLILLVVIMISTPMYLLMTNSQQRTLLTGLWDRSRVLLEGIASSAASTSALPRALLTMGESGVADLMFLPSQSASIPEAKYLTITGYGIGSIYTDHVWASNDPDILSKINTVELLNGRSQITDDLSPFYNELAEAYNSQAQEMAGERSRNIRDLYTEGFAIGTRTDAEAERLRDDMQVTITAQEVILNEILFSIGEVSSYPEFSTEKINSSLGSNYIFYKPILFRQNADDNFFRGLVRMEVSLDSIVETIAGEQRTLLITIGIVALAVMVIGVIGAFTFAVVIIRPIIRLVRHIERIRDTEDKTKLAGVDITIKTKDEIAILGSTINEMTHGLVKAAIAASDLSIGKEIQKKFIPLDVDHEGNKQSSGLKRTANLNFFGYYEGAKGVSGDYFDYRDLDGRYFAIIKCDVAGKGIPAALIMIQVATMFLGHFRRWKPTEKGFHIEDLVYQINDFIEALGFKGRFAAFTLCLYDSLTGVVRFCNAGDNIIHFYDASEKKVRTLTLPQTPATGVLPNFMIETSGGYTVQTAQLDKGDILFLYTDGIEEAKRRFRDNNYKEIICTEGPVDTEHENHLCGQADEEMTPERVEAIINAVMAREIYTLRKFHNPEDSTMQDSGLQFDFSSCEGGHVEDVIMALVSVEKIFRCYKPENAGEDSRVLVDKKVDEFLKNHFLQYRRYCSHTREFPENSAYMYYTHVMEDEQYDDLTILGIKRKENE